MIENYIGPPSAFQEPFGVALDQAKEQHGNDRKRFSISVWKKWKFKVVEERKEKKLTVEVFPEVALAG